MAAAVAAVPPPTALQSFEVTVNQLCRQQANILAHRARRTSQGSERMKSVLEYIRQLPPDDPEARSCQERLSRRQLFRKIKEGRDNYTACMGRLRAAAAPSLFAGPADADQLPADVQMLANERDSLRGSLKALHRQANDEHVTAMRGPPSPPIAPRPSC